MKHNYLYFQEAIRVIYTVKCLLNTHVYLQHIIVFQCSCISLCIWLVTAGSWPALYQWPEPWDQGETNSPYFPPREDLKFDIERLSQLRKRETLSIAWVNDGSDNNLNTILIIHEKNANMQRLRNIFDVKILTSISQTLV